MDKLRVIKIGGNVIDHAETLHPFLKAFSQSSGPQILVHGGGRRATEMSHTLGFQPVLVNGRRITTSQDLAVAVMIYGGLINKDIVAQLQANNCNAIGVSGADGNSIIAHKRTPGEIDYGWAGDIDKVNTQFFVLCLEAGLTPVCCALTHDGNGQLLNTNADTIAAELAMALGTMYETELVYCFEKDGVLTDMNDPKSVVRHLTRERYAEMKAEGRIHTGMLPKLENCFRAIDHNVSKVTLCSPQALIDGSLHVTTISP